MKFKIGEYRVTIEKRKRVRDDSFYAGKEPSDQFLEAFSTNGGGSIRECVCGRVYFNGDGGWTWEEGELESLRKKAEMLPDAYVEVGYSVTTVDIGGAEYVEGCLCGNATRVEEFIKHNARSIATYLNARAKAMKERVDAVSEEETVQEGR
jgi:hypothetical protein